MTNFQTALDATQVSLNSTGSAAKENSKYMESLEARTSAVKAAFQDLSNNLLSSDLVGVLLDLGKAVIEIANTDAGRFVLIATGITAITVALKSLWDVMKIGAAIKSLFALGTAGSDAAAGLAAFNWPLTIAIGLIATLIAFAPKIKDFYESVKDPVGHFTEKLEDSNQQLQTNKERLEEINSIPWYDRTDEIEAEKKELEDSNEALKEQIEHYRNLRAEKIAKKGTISLTTDEKVLQGTDRTGGTFLIDEKEIDRLNKIGKDAAKVYEGYGYKVTEVNKQIEVGYKDLVPTFTESYNKILPLIENGNIATNKNAQSIYNNLIPALEKAISWQEYMGDDTSVLKDQLNNLTTAYDRAKQFTLEYGDAVKLTADDVDYIKAKFPALQDQLKNTSQGWVLLQSANAQAASALITEDGRIAASAKKRAAEDLKSLEAEITARQAYVTALMSTPYSSTDVDYEQQKAKRASAISQLQSLLNAKNALYWAIDKSEREGYVADTSTGGGTKTGTGTKEVDTWKQAFDDWYAWKQHQLAMGQETEEHYIASLKLMNEKYFKGKKKYQEEYWKYTEEVYKWEIERFKEIVEQRKEALESQKSDMEAVISYAEEYSQRQIDALEKQKNALEDQKDAINDTYDAQIDALETTNDELDKEIEREQLLKNLAEARATQVMVYQNGKFVYGQDVDAVSEAQSALSDFDREQQVEEEKSLLEEKRKAELASVQSQEDALDAEIEQWQEYKDGWSNLTSDYEYNQNALIASQKYGINIENENWTTRLSNLSSFISQYNSLMSSISGTTTVSNALSEDGGSSSYKTGYGGTNYQAGINEALKKGDTDLANALNGLRNEKLESMGKGQYKQETPVYQSGHYANGTLSAVGGISMVGEKGAELRVLNKGDGIIPADATSNLMQWSKYTPSQLISSLKSTASSVIQQFSGNIILPGVTNYSQFAQEFKQRAIQAGTGQ